MGLLGNAYDTVAGAADHAAGSTDEAVARTLDDESGGGLLEGTTETAGGVYDTVAGAADHAAGSTDEAFARTFDDDEGGGLWDGYTGVLDHASGSVDESIARQFDDTEGGGFADVLRAGYVDQLGENYQTLAGIGDWAAGDLDETVGAATGGRSIAIIVGGAAALAAGLAALVGRSSSGRSAT